MTRILFVASSIAVAVMSLRFLIAPIDLVMAHMVHYLAGFKLAAYGHLIFGPIALAALPLQMQPSLRAQYPGFHRWLGRFAALSMLIAGVSALAFLPAFQGTRFAAAGFAVLGLLWIVFTIIAVQAARRRDFARHRAFMLRAGALTFGAVTLRIIMAPLMAMGWSVTETYQITAWGCWLPSLLLVEYWLRQESKRAPVGAQ